MSPAVADDPWARAKAQARRRIDVSGINELLALANAPTAGEEASAAAWLLGLGRVRRRALPGLIDGLVACVERRDLPEEVRAHAAEAIGHQLQCSGERGIMRRTARQLGPQLNDASPAVRFWCAFALGQLGQPSSRRWLRRVAGDRAAVPGWWTVGEEALDAIAIIERREVADREAVGRHQPER